ncbi:Post-GPI attachment to proteins factor 6 [Galemys pyrenaicus]|uniref:Post-GPI attachment to proteins factor 6 n=1 Tax=Galemys pyrenaicus TaxID=202257 RepID=A0A8J6DGW9_GALPY|nr:Post-GPI attachment to proteins factor 6 [Galemys pyrenaicus]
MGRAGLRGTAGAVAGPPPLLLLLLLAWPPLAAAGDSGKSEGRLVSEQFLQTPQKLSPYSWYGSARLFRFRVPPDTVLLRWLLGVARAGGPACAQTEVTVHFRYGAPPVINPLDTSFPPNTPTRPSFFVKMLDSNTSVSLSYPAAGDWFVAAHLPPASQKIEVQGFVPAACTYAFQPDMLLLRAVEVSVLEPDVPLPQTLRARPSYLRVFVPKHTQQLRLELRGCAANGSLGCPVRLTAGPATLPGDLQKVLVCTSPTRACGLLLPSPPWDRWLQVAARSLAGPHAEVVFSVVAILTGGPWERAARPRWPRPAGPAPLTPCPLAVCRPAGIQPVLPSSLNQSGHTSADPPAPSPVPAGSPCFFSHPAVREDVDVLSVRLRPLDRLSVLAGPWVPTVVRLPLGSGMDSGGSLTVSLWANKSAMAEDTWVAACLGPASPFLSFNASHSCTTAFSQGYPLVLNASAPKAGLVVPYPETDDWYLSLQLKCPQSPGGCAQASVPVETALYLAPCLDDCGPYGQCLLLRRHGYLYAGCSCKAGWRGWSCTDNSTAQTVAQQRVATLLLTLSNLGFLAPIAVALHRTFLVEASVYAYTMFFSTFYHACDQPGEAVLCILSYDTLQYCDFLGSGVSIWVTILCMARLRAALKYVSVRRSGQAGGQQPQCSLWREAHARDPEATLCLVQVLFLLGTLVFAMSLQLDRRGAWNTLGPCLFALLVMVAMWVYRCGHRRRCYPPSWQRWVFYLLPGLTMAAVAIAIYAAMMTNDNYYYTHSVWHVLLAGSTVCLLPPRDQHAEPWACTRRLTCHYQICRNHREELYTVT